MRKGCENVAETPEKSSRPRLLVLAGQREADDDLLNFLRTGFDIDLACELDEALEALRNRQYGAVVAAADDYLPLERGLVQQQAAGLLNVIGDGVCVVSPEGRMVWANPQMKQADAALREKVVGYCHKAATAARGRTCQFAFQHDQKTYEVTCSLTENQGGNIAAILSDATSAEQDRQKMRAIYEAGQELVRLGGASTEQMDPGQRLAFIEERVMHFTRDVLHYDHFALRVVDERRGKLTLLACMGLPEEAREVEVDVSTEPGNGIAGYVAATGETYMCPDTEADDRYRCIGLAGAQSLLSAPLRLKDRVIGVFSLESHHKNAFSDADQQFVENLASYIALSLNILNLLSVERYSATNEITTTVTSELAGPLNDIRTEAASLIDEYIGHDDMRPRLQRIIDRAEGIGQTVKDIAESPQRGVLSSGPAATEPDEIIGGKRVLVADDEAIIRETICDVLERRGAIVDSAADGEQAERLIAEGRYQLVLSDIKMPRRTGYDVFAAAKKRDPSTAVILITGFGYDPNHSIVRANREGLAAVLFKPFKVDQLLEEVRGALAES